MVHATAGEALLTGAMDEAAVRAGAEHVLEIHLHDALWPEGLDDEC